MKTRTVNMIEVSDWDDLVEKTYGRPYSFQQQDDCKERGTHELTVPDSAEDYENDTLPVVINGSQMGVSFAAWLAADPTAEIPDKDASASMKDFYIELWWGRNFYPDVQMIANDLHARGLLDAGKYVINIDW